MSKIQLSQRMYSVRDINRLFESSEMLLQPKYQRRRTAWPLNAKTALIDTMMNNFPIPPVYLRDYVNEEGKRYKEIIDGQQRISTILEYFNDKFSLSKNIYDTELSGCLYSELPHEEQLLIEDFEVSFISIRGASDSDIISIFSRLNSYSLPLNNQEKRNSLYAGEVKSLIYELASEYNKFWIDTKVLSAVQIARMADALLVSEIIFTILYGYRSASSRSLDKMYDQFDEEFPCKIQTYNNFNNVITILGNFFESRHIRKTFKPKFMFSTMFLVVYERMYGLEGREAEGGTINLVKSLELLEKFCVDFSHPQFSAEKKAQFKQATGNPSQRKFRHAEIKKLVV